MLQAQVLLSSIDWMPKDKHHAQNLLIHSANAEFQPNLPIEGSDDAMWDLNFLKMMCSAALWLVFLSPSAWAEEALEARVVALEQELSVLRALVTVLVPQAALESQLTVETKVLPVPSGIAAKVADASQGFSYQGFIQLDSLLSRYSDGKPGGGALGRLTPLVMVLSPSQGKLKPTNR